MALHSTSPEGLIFVLIQLGSNPTERRHYRSRKRGRKKKKEGEKEEEEELKGKSASTSRKILHAYK
jgi:hypothetical protein